VIGCVAEAVQRLLRRATRAKERGIGPGRGLIGRLELHQAGVHPGQVQGKSRASFAGTWPVVGCTVKQVC